jgi:hypothetical protein
VNRLHACIAFAAALAATSLSARAEAAELCPAGWWADAMIASHHINPDRKFDEFNPGVGLECSVTKQWAASVGYFRNSLDRPSFYGGVVFTPELTHWGWFRLGLMGGLISGYNYGRWGIGPNGSTGPVLAPTIITQFGRFAVNFILIAPIPEDRLPFTIGFQAKYRFR